MTKHTPKPWVVGKRGLIMAEVGKSGPHGEGFAIAEVYGCDEMIASGERDANANLFAAAPDLLAARQDGMVSVEDWMALARAVAACQERKAADYLTEEDFDNIIENERDWDEATDGPLPTL